MVWGCNIECAIFIRGRRAQSVSRSFVVVDRTFRAAVRLCVILFREMLVVVHAIFELMHHLFH